MTEQAAIHDPRARFGAAALVVSLVAGSFGMTLVAAHMSNEITRSDRAAPVSLAPAPGHRSVPGVP